MQTLTTFTDGDYPVTWQASKRQHVITYGQQVEKFAGKDRDIAACHAFGECVRHSLECAGKLYL